MYKADVDIIPFNQVVKTVNSLDEEARDFVNLKVAVLRNITIDTVVPYLKFLCYENNLKAEIYMGDYDVILPEVMDDNSKLYHFGSDLIIVCLKLECLSEKLSFQFSGMSADEIGQESERIVHFIEKVLHELRKHTNSTVLIHNFEVPVHPSFGTLDYQELNKQVNTVRKLNVDVLNTARNYDGVYIIDVDLLQSTIGYLNYFDNRYWHIGKAPYTREACNLIAKEYIKFIRSLKGKSKKCLVLDCDNTLWGGIIGEDGIAGINLGRTFPGSAYREFQQTVLNLYNRGVILAVASKNNESDVIEVMENHPDMILRKEFFASMKIGWKDKMTNLQDIADELNIGLDSLVFVDDSDFEVNMVRKMLPEVTTIKLGKDPCQYRDLLNSYGGFDTLTFSKEDSMRTEMYRKEAARNQARKEFSEQSLEDYYRYLEMEVSVSRADEFAIPRISQLTQKTNQFNLTTHRYSESEIISLIRDKKADIYLLELKDQFGSSGIVGVAIVKSGGSTAIIDTFLLSCRVIGRGAEDVLLNVCIMLARQNDCDTLIGMYKASKKNGQVEGFYRDRKFECIENKDGVAKYSLSIRDYQSSFPEYFKSIKIDNSLNLGE